MKPRDVAELLLLAAVWGTSFGLMRATVPAFGPFALAALRVAGASLLLVPILMASKDAGPAWAACRRHWRPLVLVGLCNSALPFAFFAYATEIVEAGVAAIVNSATPLFAALVARVWLGDRLTAARAAGLAIGFAGVLWVVAERTGVRGAGTGLAMLACIAGTLCYAIAPSLTKRHLGGVPPLAVATASQLAATAFLAAPAILAWPTTLPSAATWGLVGFLAFSCTGFAYVLYFRLIAHAGPQNAVSVTYLVPVFAVAWGYAFLGERLAGPVIAACGVVFAGTALATGVWPRPRPALDRERGAAG